MKFEPELLKFLNGKEVINAEDFRMRQKEMLDILSREEYGYMPPVLGETTYKVNDVTKGRCCAGHGRYRALDISFPTEKGIFTFPIHLVTPKKENYPLFLFINFDQPLHNGYTPLEEIIDRGYGVAYVWYDDITSDDANMQDKLAGMYTRPDNGSGYGKISLWAFGVSRMLDAVIQMGEVDKDKIAVIGHSRLGKTALWCGANDERINYVISNDSGCCGAAYERFKHPNAETFDLIYKKFPYWFCENLAKYTDDPSKAPFDQHFLLACSVPRNILVGSADKDLWADPIAEQSSCCAVSELYKLFGKDGFSGNEKPAETGMSFDEGCVHYHLREGEHFLSRNDWNRYIDFINRKQN